MSLGTIVARIRLDQPLKVHHGKDEPVAGVVELIYNPSLKTRTETSNEFFGPLKVSMTLHGRAKSKIVRSNGQSSTTYRGRVQLFSQSMTIYDGSFKAQPGERNYFPFRLQFPETAQRSSDAWGNDTRFAVNNSEPLQLPPTFRRDYGNRFEGFVEYRLGCDVSTGRLQVKVEKPHKDTEPHVHYERARLEAPVATRPIEFKGIVTVQNELLLPEADRPTGFKQKAKAAFSSDYYPTYVFNWSCEGPQDIYVDQPLAFDMRIKPQESSTAVLIPEVRLSTFSVEIKSFVAVQVDKGLFRNMNNDHDDTVMTLMGNSLSPRAPFSKESDWSKTIKTKEISELPSSFKAPNIAVQYRLKVRGSFHVAGKTKDFQHSWLVTLHPPLQRPGAVAGPSSAAATSSAPRLNMTEIDAALPQYERPPEYDEAAEDGPSSVPPPTSSNGKRPVVDASLR